ncbi:hypothetical protein D3879_25150 [Pseudomonas cavernicola]|uniref:Uncharacterized protein n=1 Tax=Pseudomonas cavernicola TaxID=2320866 RepID=A0A418X9C5_9PSED|nr:hypothetical protein D3879_25150 [Pseudomonas cavernicola]
MRCVAWISCCSMVLMATKRMLGRLIAPMLKAHVETWFANPQAGMLSLSAAGLVGVCLLWGLHGSRRQGDEPRQQKAELAN